MAITLNQARELLNTWANEDPEGFYADGEITKRTIRVINGQIMVVTHWSEGCDYRSAESVLAHRVTNQHRQEF